MPFFAGFIVFALIILIFVAPGVRVIRQYERGVIFTLGKFSGIRNPGLCVVVRISTVEIVCK